MSAFVWWVIGIVVVLAVVAFLVSRSMNTRRLEARREEASSLRNDAEEQERVLRQHQAAADETAAQARRAQAEADESAARAEQLRVESERRGDTAREAQSAHAEQLRRADALDPDVATDDDGHRLDTADASNAAEDGVPVASETTVDEAGPDSPLSSDNAADGVTAEEVTADEVTADDRTTPAAEVGVDGATRPYRVADDRGPEVTDDGLRADGTLSDRSTSDRGVGAQE